MVIRINAFDMHPGMLIGGLPGETGAMFVKSITRDLDAEKVIVVAVAEDDPGAPDVVFAGLDFNATVVWRTGTVGD